MANLKTIIGEDLFKQLSSEKQKEYEKQDLEDVSDGKYVDKERFNQVNEQAKEYKKQVGERDKQLTDLQSKVKDNEELTKELENLKTANSTTTAEYEKKLETIKFDTTLDNALKDSKAKDINLIKALLEKDKLKVDGDNVIGLKEQIESIKKEKDYLFEKEIPGTGSFITGGKDNEDKNSTNFASELGKEKAASMQPKGIADFAK